jgi:hypothetical protein
VHWHEEERLRAWEASQHAAAVQDPPMDAHIPGRATAPASPKGSRGKFAGPRVPADVLSTAAPPAQLPVSPAVCDVAHAEHAALLPAADILRPALPASTRADVQQQRERMSGPEAVTQGAQAVLVCDSGLPNGAQFSEKEGTVDAAAAAEHPVQGDCGTPGKDEGEREGRGGDQREALDSAAMLRRPQRPPAKPLPPVPRFDR